MDNQTQLCPPESESMETKQEGISFRAAFFGRKPLRQRFPGIEIFQILVDNTKFFFVLSRIFLNHKYPALN